MNKRRIINFCKTLYSILLVLSLVSCGGGGGSSAGDTSGSPGGTAKATPRFVYVANYGVLGTSGMMSDVSAFSVDASGSLTKIPCVSSTTVVCDTSNNYLNYEVGPFPFDIAADPTGKFLFVASGYGSLGISVYAIDSSSGALSQVPCQSSGTVTCDSNNGYIVDTSTTFAIAFDPSGKHVFMVNDGGGAGNYGNVAVFSVDAGGMLTPIPCDSTTGAVCNGNNYTVGFNPVYATVDPSGKYFYLANSEGSTTISNANNGDIAAYAISGSGVMTPIVCDSTAGSVCNGNNYLLGGNTDRIAIDAADKYVYASNMQGDVAVYQIASGGALLPVPCKSASGIDCNSFSIGTSSISSYAVGNSLGHLTLDPTGRFLFGASKGLAVLATSASGTLTPVPCVSGNGMTCVTDTVKTKTMNYYPLGLDSRGIVFDSAGKNVYVAINEDTSTLSSTLGDVQAFAIASSGTLTPITCNSSAGQDCKNAGFAAGFTPYRMTATP